MTIRFLKPQLPTISEVAPYFARAEAAGWYSNGGPCHELMIERMEAYLGSGIFAVPVANATLGLMVGLRALLGARPQRREVLVPSFTFAATVEAVLWAGLDPVFVDVNADTWHMEPQAVRDALEARGENVGLVLACSTFGMPPTLTQREAWEQAASEAGARLLVDSAAGFGAVGEDGLALGRQGDAEVFSFHATKPFAIGEGGLLTTTLEDVAARAVRLTNFGFDHGVVNADIGLNAKMSEWSAATALATLDRYDDVLARRRATAEQMLEALAPHGYERQGGGGFAAWQFVPVLAPSAFVREEALELAYDGGIELRSYFREPLHTMAAFASIPVAGDLHQTEMLADRILSLPMANDLSPDHRGAIVGCLIASSHAAAATTRRVT